MDAADLRKDWDKMMAQRAGLALGDQARRGRLFAKVFLALPVGGIGATVGMAAVAVGFTFSASTTYVALVLALLVVVLPVSLWIMQRLINVLHIKQPTIPGFFYLTYLIMLFFPALFIAAGKPAPYRNSYLFAVGSVLLSVPAGIWLANRLFRFQRREVREFFSKSVEEIKPSYHLRVIFALLLIGTATSVYLYLREVEVVPLLAALQNPGAYYELTQLREKAFKLLDTGLSYLYFWVRALFLPFLILFALGYYLHSRQKCWLLFFLLSLGMGVFYAGLSLAKMPVAAIFLMITLFVYLYKAGKVGKGFALLAVVFILAFPILVVLLVQHGSGIGLLDALYGILRRLFYVPAYVLYYYFEIFPDRVDYLYGRSIGRLAWLLGWEHFNTANYVYRYIFPHGAPSGLSNAAFIGNLNADFGLLGVIIGGFFAGFLMQAIQIFVLRRRKTPLNLTLYAFLIYAFWLLNHTALPIVLFSNGVILALILPWVIRATENFLRESIEVQRVYQNKAIGHKVANTGGSV